ncbi:hypothetical protein IQ07DRAFT_556227 [Pyrenochaeta sp. DS3sAY3a]|nr:hypothetical protein IQ07DRAFT_556227 [Pyrenochaeta sp. DS3sAY3a]
MAETPEPVAPFPFLRLPRELRDVVYSLYFKPADRLIHSHSLEAKGYYGGLYKFDFDLVHVNRQVYTEASAVWRRENIFVKLATPWPSAGMYRIYLMATDGRDLMDFGAGGKLLVNHISSEGLVPIVCMDEKADVFTTHHGLVQITAPFHQAVPEHTVVVLLDDLPKFTQTWYYSALSFPMLNDRLSTTFVLRHPQYSSKISGELHSNKEIPLSLQRRLLLPFEQVKGLYHMGFSGYAPSVQEELERRMALPIPTLQECCESATDLMAQGDVALAANTPLEALELYRKAFHAVHILIHGRTRRVLADVFFHDGIENGRYAGQTGMTVRVVLRLKLVSRTVAAYLQLHEYGEAAYWGMRSIRIMREALDTEFEDFLTDFLGDSDVGLIYLRTGIALYKMETDLSTWLRELSAHTEDPLGTSAMLWGPAARYLRKGNLELARRELRAFGVPESVVEGFGETGGAEEVASTAGQSGSDREDYDDFA